MNWKVLYDNIMEMRKSIVAPVDVMGCFKNAESDKGPKVYFVMLTMLLSYHISEQKMKTIDAKHPTQRFSIHIVILHCRKRELVQQNY